jgi:hypothetical protein
MAKFVKFLEFCRFSDDIYCSRAHLFQRRNAGLEEMFCALLAFVSTCSNVSGCSLRINLGSAGCFGLSGSYFTHLSISS